ncbi:MAG: DUF4962 domain-containing protein [Chloroflexi bacterium]|nr:MAG: DUF4962 domain-containing protein [Chloroflexota bacterium]
MQDDARRSGGTTNRVLTRRGLLATFGLAAAGTLLAACRDKTTPAPTATVTPIEDVASASQHPRLLFAAAELLLIRSRAGHPQLKPVADRLVSRANTLLAAKPLLVSTTGRGELDPPGTLKGLDAARRLQGRVITLAMAFLLSGDRRYRDAAVGQLDDAIVKWPAWVDTAHPPPYDLMAGEMSLTFGLAYDWLHDALSEAERRRIVEGVERRALQPYLNAAGGSKPASWYAAVHNWNPVCNGGATVLALALGADSALSAPVLELSVPTMARYWGHLGADGGWDEGTGYWVYGHRYAFIAADALRRAGRREGADYLSRPGARTTGYFPLVFNPGTRLSASFGDSATRGSDPLFYFLGREYRNPDFVWAQDRVAARALTSEGWPEEALTLIWRPVDERWLPEAQPGFRPMVPAVGAFPSIGWSMLASAQPDPPLFLAFKSGSLAANHSHLDLNHVTVGMGNNMLLVDLGSRPYPADYFQRTARARYYEITTAGHNSVLVGGKGQVFDRLGVLQGPLEGPNFTAFVGVADGSYEMRTPHARRHVVFVDKRYYVLLDDVAPASPAPVELRFHSYGTIAPRPSGGWTVTQGDSVLDVVPAQTLEISGSIEAPSGWIRPVSLLRIASRQPLGQLTLATALIPQLPNGARPTLTSQEVRGAELLVTVGADHLVFERTADGYLLQSVTLGK